MDPFAEDERDKNGVRDTVEWETEAGVQSMQQGQGERRKMGKRERAREWFRGVGF